MTTSLKYLAEILISNVDKKGIAGETDIKLCNYVDVYYNSQITSDIRFMGATATKSQIAKFSLRGGEILVTKDSEIQDDIAASAYVPAALPGVLCGYHLAVIRTLSGLNSRYLFWFLNSLETRLRLASASTGVTRFGLRQDAIRQLQVVVPPEREQHRVADMLDAKVSDIDRAIESSMRLVALTDEAIDAEMKHEIEKSALADAANGRSEPIRRVLQKLARPSNESQEMITAFRNGQVTARRLRRAEGYTQSVEEGAKVQGVRENDVVIHGLDGFAGAIGTSEIDGVCSPVYHVCIPTNGGDPWFYGRLLRVLAVDNYLGLFATSTRERAIDFRNWELFSHIPVPVVDLARQRELAEKLDRRNRLVQLAIRTNQLLKERRQALITAAVTGQLEIPGAA